MHVYCDKCGAVWEDWKDEAFDKQRDTQVAKVTDDKAKEGSDLDKLLAGLSQVLGKDVKQLLAEHLPNKPAAKPLVKSEGQFFEEFRAARSAEKKAGYEKVKAEKNLQKCQANLEQAQEKLQHTVATQREATAKLDQIKTSYFGAHPAKAKERLEQAEEDNKRERQQENRENHFDDPERGVEEQEEEPDAKRGRSRSRSRARAEWEQEQMDLDQWHRADQTGAGSSTPVPPPVPGTPGAPVPGVPPSSG